MNSGVQAATTVSPAPSDIKSAREIELEQQVAALKQRIEAFEGEKLIQLPNKDLWRGLNTKRERPDTLRAEPPRPVDSAMAQILKAAGRPTGTPQLTCLWCGQQYFGEEPMRDHLNKSHQSVVNPPSAAEQMAMKVAIDQANAELEKK